jgi:hypothetical protein
VTRNYTHGESEVKEEVAVAYSGQTKVISAEIQATLSQELLSFQNQLLCCAVLNGGLCVVLEDISRHDSLDQLHTRCVRNDWAQLLEMPEHALFP